MKRFPTIFAVVLVAVALLIAARFHVRQDLGWVDSISGSWKRQTVWRVGGASMPVVTESPIAARYRRLGLQWQPDWKNVQGAYMNLFGWRVGHAHGTAPEIYTLATDQTLQRSYLAASTDDEVRQLFEVMATGTEAEKTTAVEAACDKGIDHYTATPPNR